MSKTIKVAVLSFIFIMSISLNSNAGIIGGAFTVFGTACSIAGAAISAYQLSTCDNGLTGNLANSTLSYNGNETSFNLSFVGGDFDSNNLNKVISGTYGEGVAGVNGVFAVTNPWWSWQLILNEDAGIVNDVLSING